MRRLATAAGAAAIGLLLMTTAALGGGWALIQPDDGAPPRPNAGEEVRLGFDVLQHGVTPISWVKATLVATNMTTGREVSAVATPDEPEGHYVALVTFPDPGYWTWRVELTDLVAQSVPGVVAVNTAAGVAPSLDTTALLTIVERSKADTGRQVEQIVGPTVDQYESRLSRMDVELAVAKGQVATLSQSRDRLEARVAELEARGGAGSGSPSSEAPILAVVTISALAGAASGFGMVVLGRRGEPGTGAEADEGSPAYAATRPTTR